MNAKHHLSDAVLTAYAAGSLDEAYALVVACHLSLCDQCRADAMALELLGGEMLEDLPEAPVRDDALEATLARIEAGDPTRAQVSPVKENSVFPAPLQAYAGPDASDVQWNAVGGGVRQKVLECGGEAKARLLYIPSGRAVPDHGHRGLELTLVLQGSFSDHVDRFARGDVEIGHPDLEHQPLADPGEDCICLAATDAPLRFNALIPRLFQPFLGI